jgi:hypothetical protein
MQWENERECYPTHALNHPINQKSLAVGYSESGGI